MNNSFFRGLGYIAIGAILENKADVVENTSRMLKVCWKFVSEKVNNFIKEKKESAGSAEGANK